jgi:hypothetical protein
MCALFDVNSIIGQVRKFSRVILFVKKDILMKISKILFIKPTLIIVQLSYVAKYQLTSALYFITTLQSLCC